MTHPTNALKGVLFDLDGTLLDTAPDFAAVVNELLKRHNRPLLDYPLIRATVSNGSKALVTLSFGVEEGDKGFEELRQQLLELYLQQLAVKTKPFDGILELLDWLDKKQLPWGIVTNKPRLYTEPLLISLGLTERCRAIVCPDDVINTKPNPESLHLACQQMQCKAEHTIYIGDHRRDIEAGRNANMQTIAANYGYIESGDCTEDWLADYYVEHASELMPIIKSKL